MKPTLKQVIPTLFLFLLSITFYAQSTVNVDVEKSNIHWKGYKPAGSHAGTIKLLSGAIEVENNQIKGGNFVADMTTIKDDDGSPKLERHLKSPDFFEIETYPTSSFEIKSIKKSENGTFLIGNLTIKNVTKEMEIPATVIVDQNKIEIKTKTIKVNRADFHVKYKSKSFFKNLKDKFILDDFDLQVTIIANK